MALFLLLQSDSFCVPMTLLGVDYDPEEGNRAEQTHFGICDL